MAVQHTFPPPAATLRRAAGLAVLLAVPLVVAALVAGAEGILPAGMGVMSAAVAPYCTKRQAAGFMAALVLIGTAATAAVGHDVAVVLLVILTCLAAGLASRISAGIFGIAPVVVAVLALDATGASPLQVGLIMAGVSAYVAVIIHVAKIHIPPAPVPLSAAVRHGVVMAAACGTATVVALRYDWPHSYWLVMTLAIVLRPYARDSLVRNRQRVLGTLAGAVLAVILSPLPRFWQILFAVICMALVLSYIMLADYLLQVAFTTPMVVFLVSSGTLTDTLNMDALRVLYTVSACAVGGALALLLARQDDT